MSVRKLTNRSSSCVLLYGPCTPRLQSFVLRYSDLIEKLPTRAFLAPMKEDEEVEIELSKVSHTCLLAPTRPSTTSGACLRASFPSACAGYRGPFCHH